MTSRPHDALFKSGFANPSHIPSLYLGSYPAEICNRIDWSSLRPEPASFIDARLDDDHTDLLYTARLHTLAESVYLLVEHQSTNDPDMPLRMHTYLDRIYEHQRNQKVKPLAHVLPLIVTHALGGWTAPRRFCELFAPAADDDADLSRLTPQFDVTILDVTQMTNQDIDALHLADFGKLVLWLLRDGRTWPLLRENMQYWVPTLRRARLTLSGTDYFSRLLRYVFDVTDGLTYRVFCAKLQEQIPETEEIHMTMAEELRQEGRLEGSLSVLEKLLTLKFGEIGIEHRERLAGASEEQLGLYAQRVLTAATLEAVFVEPS